MKTINHGKLLTIANTMVCKAQETLNRAKQVQADLLNGSFGDVEFPLEMIRESISGLEFWIAEFEKAVAK